MKRIRVAIYGAGIGGLSAAHELAKFPDLFEVHVYEGSDRVGGKASSQYLTGTGSGGRRDLPGEHGFRFFPAFYQHLDQTMAEIPTEDGGSVLDQLVGSLSFAVARTGRRPAVARRRFRRDLRTVADAVQVLSTWFAQEGLDLSALDLANLVHAITKFMMSSERRRIGEFDHMSWYEFTNSDFPIFTDSYRALTKSLPRTMVAMDGQYGSAYTIGKAGGQLFFLDAMRSDGIVDRVLNAPTTESWLNPWEKLLRSRGVNFHFGERLKRLNVEQDKHGFRIASGEMSSGKSSHADFHICAIPVERMNSVIDDDLCYASRSFRKIREHLSDQTDWMVGAQYYLKRDIKVAHGHVIYPDSPWALSSISQAQFWASSRGALEARYGDGNTCGILSVDISNWDTIAPRLGRTAKQCTREEILDETFKQILEGLNTSANTLLNHDDVVHRYLDNNIQFDGPGRTCSANQTPLLVHAPGTFRYRPASHTEIRNLSLASDYVSTHTNLATMEGANEAAKRAIRSIYRQIQWRGYIPEVNEMREPNVFIPFRLLDDLLYEERKELGHVFDLESSRVSEVSDLLRDRAEESLLARARGALSQSRTAFKSLSKRGGVEKALQGVSRLESAVQEAESKGSQVLLKIPAYMRSKYARSDQDVTSKVRKISALGSMSKRGYRLTPRHRQGAEIRARQRRKVANTVPSPSDLPPAG